MQTKFYISVILLLINLVLATELLFSRILFQQGPIVTTPQEKMFSLKQPVHVTDLVEVPNPKDYSQYYPVLKETQEQPADENDNVGLVTLNSADKEQAQQKKDQEVCEVSPQTWIGKASYYSANGCMGCSPGQIMANGEVFNENDYTIAFMRLPLNTEVIVTNLDTNKSVKARVTDTGGFEGLGRIADLSLAVSQAVALSTDVSHIQISSVQCSCELVAIHIGQTVGRRYASRRP